MMGLFLTVSAKESLQASVRLVRESLENLLCPRIRNVLVKEEIGRVGPLHLCWLSQQTIERRSRNRNLPE